MGRKRQKVEEEPMLESLSIFSRYMASKVEEQETGQAFYGESVARINDRQANAMTFYPFQLDAPFPPVKLPVFHPDQFHVEHADPTLLSITMPMLLHQLMEAAGPAPNPRSVSAHPTIDPKQEKAMVEQMRKEGRSWQQISAALGSTKTAASLRKRYRTYSSTPVQASPGPTFVGGASPLQHSSGTPMLGSAFHNLPPRSATPPAGSFLRAPSPVAKVPLMAQRADSGGSTDSRTPTTAAAGAAAAAQRDPRLAAAGIPSQVGDSGTQQLAVQLPPVPNPAVEDLVHGIRVVDMINLHGTNRAGGEDRVALKKPIKKFPEGFTGRQAHKLTSLAGVKFFEEVVIQDPDDPDRLFTFNVNDRIHCPCFHIGEGADGSPLLSWSDIFSLYQMPDGSTWAEHGFYNDAEDLEQLGKRIGRSHAALIPADMGQQELLRRKGRYHSRLQNIEYECWIYQGELPKDLPCPPDEAFYWRYTFDPYTLERSQ